MIRSCSPATESALFRSPSDQARNPGFAFTLDRLEHGWAGGVVKTGRYSVAVTASYLSDGIGHLLSAVAELTTGASEVRCSWVCEPGEYRWLFWRPGELVIVQIRGFAEAENPQPDDAGHIIIEFAVTLPVLANSLVAAIADHPHARTEDQYVENWGHPYPRTQLAALQAFIAMTSPIRSASTSDGPVPT
jgi:hypothetical protein